MLSAARRALSITKALDQIIDREGREYTNHRADKGGPTKFGVTRTAYRAYMNQPNATADDVRNMDETLARCILREDFLEGHGFGAIKDDVSYNILLDCAVLHGPRGASIILQRALDVKTDGIIGPVTAGKANALRRKDLVSKLLTERGRWFINICERDPSQLVFLEGWMMHRVFAFLPY